MLLSKKNPGIVILTPKDLVESKNPKSIRDFVNPDLHELCQKAELILMLSKESLDNGQLEIVLFDAEKVIKNWSIYEFKKVSKVKKGVVEITDNSTNQNTPKRGPGGRFLPKEKK